MQTTSWAYSGVEIGKRELRSNDRGVIQIKSIHIEQSVKWVWGSTNNDHCLRFLPQLLQILQQYLGTHIFLRKVSIHVSLNISTSLDINVTPSTAITSSGGLIDSETLVDTSSVSLHCLSQCPQLSQSTPQWSVQIWITSFSVHVMRAFKPRLCFHKIF